ncbi:MAG: VOC family protein [Candidatus Adiutrix sp.]|nr:VOC family protein [Candidatus Adiutrix sp.]
MHFRQVGIRTQELEKSIEFYESVIGLSVVRRVSGEDSKLAFLADAQGGTQVELVNRPHMQAFEREGFFLCFEADDLDATHALATSKGLAPSDIRSPDAASRYFYVYDPNKISVQIRQKNS